MGRMYDFISNSQDGVLGVDNRQTVVLWNEAASDMLGYRTDEVLGTKCYGILQGRDANGCTVCRRGCKPFVQARGLELPPTVDMAARTKAGDDVWLNVSTIVVPSRRDDLSVLIHVFREVTREHRLQQVVRDFAEVVSGLPGKRRSRRSNPRCPATECIELTRREREILAELASGVSTTVIADKLCISPRTVRNHVNNVLNKLGVHSRLEAVTYSIRNGLV